MDYQIREGVKGVRLELRGASVKIGRSGSRALRINVSGGNDSSIRAIPHDGKINIKYISDTGADIRISLPENLREIEIIKESGSLRAEKLELDSLSVNSGGDIELSEVTVSRSCNLSTDGSSIRLISCDISSMSVQISGGELETDGTVLHGNNTAYVMGSTVRGTLRGALAEYVISAGSGVSADEVIVNEHRLSEFPDRRNVQNCAWLLIAGSLKETARLKISKPRYINGY